ncbi:hypothetical protein TNCV_406451 [Trichonephila clavipes]|nr:hypothetical protein TNCV_406451 [Trichonephila clavipes]
MCYLSTTGPSVLKTRRSFSRPSNHLRDTIPYIVGSTTTLGYVVAPLVLFLPIEVDEKVMNAIVNIIGLCCSEGSLSLGSGNEGKREIVLNRRPELYRGKYRCVQTKINLLKRRSYACETQCFPVEPSGCRRGAFT